MSVSSFFEKCVGLQQQRALTAIATYRDLVAGTATGEEPNPAESSDYCRKPASRSMTCAAT
jgi:hypothetical protein